MLDLEGKFLVSKPTMRDARFRETVIMVMEHTSSHSLGLIINKPIHTPSIKDSACDFDIKSIIRQPNHYLFYGGPVNLNKIMIIHTPDLDFGAGTHRFNDEVWVSNNQDVMKSVLQQGAPHPANWLIVIGQCTWSAGQLEAEILSKNGRMNTDAWLTTTLDANTIFGMKYQNRWKKTVNRIAQEQFTRTFSHAVQTQ